MEKAGFMNMGIVDYESEDNTCEISENQSESDDEFPELNIYEKIQMLLFENQFINNTYYLSDINNYPDILLNNKKTKAIPIPKKK